MIEPRRDGLLLPDLRPSTALDAADPRASVQRALVRGDDGVLLHAHGAFVTTAALRAWPASERATLGVATLTGSLDVEASTRNEASDQYRWRIHVGGREVTRDGSWLAPATLLDEDQERVFGLAEQVATCTTRSERLACLGELQAIAHRRSDIALGPLLAKYPVFVASTLRIGFTEEPDGLAPVARLAGPFGEIDLPEADLERVACAGFAQTNSQLVGGRWVVTQPAVARNALLTSTARRAPAHERAKFMENPTAFAMDEEAFDAADYSARVRGVGTLDAPPPQVRKDTPREWASPGIPLVVLDAAGREVSVPAERVPELHEALSAAIAAGSPVAAFGAAEIPASPVLLRAVERVLEGDRPAADDEPEERARPLALLIRENDLVLEWAPPPEAGRAIASRRLPQMNVELKEHQHVAIEQLQRAWAAGEPGALLCDDMGLGKTLQALIFGAWVARQHAPGTARDCAVDVPVAIVAPPNLLETWVKELIRRLPPTELPVVLWGASERPSADVDRRLLSLSDFLTDGRGRGVTLPHARIDREALAAARPSVLLVSYDQVRRLQFALGTLHIGVLIADEAHWAKDPTTLRSHALRAMNADFKLALTGTPIENSWRDLWTLCDWAVPGQLGTWVQFQERYPSDGEVRAVGQGIADRLKGSLIRRTRTQVLDELPPCRLTREDRPMPHDQRVAYDAEQLRHSRGPGSGLALLRGLSMTSLHPRQRADLPDARAAHAWAQESARTQILWEALARFRAEDAAVLVFVRSLAMQETLQRALQLAFDLPFVGVLNGESGTIAQRNRMVSEVEGQRGFRVMLVSPEVGGVGWNLQFATRAVLLERTWNPAKEAQMIARIHRLGQTQEVEVVTPLAVVEGRRTFDLLLDELLTEKRELSQSVLAPSEVSDEEVSGRFRELMVAPPTE